MILAPSSDQRHRPSNISRPPPKKVAMLLSTFSISKLTVREKLSQTLEGLVGRRSGKGSHSVGTFRGVCVVLFGRAEEKDCSRRSVITTSSFKMFYAPVRRPGCDPASIKIATWSNRFFDYTCNSLTAKQTIANKNLCRAQSGRCFAESRRRQKQSPCRQRLPDLKMRG